MLIAVFIVELFHFPIILDEDGENISKTKKAYYESTLTPAMWFEPKEVWEVAFADITLSPTYSAALGLVSNERGLSLRFPRFLRKREDKSIEETNTPQFLAGMTPSLAAKSGLTKAQDLYFKQELVSANKDKKSTIEGKTDALRKREIAKGDVELGAVVEELESDRDENLVAGTSIF